MSTYMYIHVLYSIYVHVYRYYCAMCVQLTQCVEEFESLVGLSTSLLEGQQPTSAMLFGPEGTCILH